MSSGKTPEPGNPPANETPLPSAEGSPIPEALAHSSAMAERKITAVKDTLGTVALVATLGTAGVLISGVFLTPCVGATRSASLEWEKRQQEATMQIAQVEAMLAAEQQTSADQSSDDEESAHE
jgi:hypothetical protein